MKGKKCQQITQKKTGDLCQNNTHRIPDRKTPITKIKIKISKNSQLKESFSPTKKSQEGKNWKEFTLEGWKLQRIHP